MNTLVLSRHDALFPAAARTQRALPRLHSERVALGEQGVKLATHLRVAGVIVGDPLGASAMLAVVAIFVVLALERPAKLKVIGRAASRAELLSNKLVRGTALVTTPEAEEQHGRREIFLLLRRRGFLGLFDFICKV